MDAEGNVKIKGTYTGEESGKVVVYSPPTEIYDATSTYARDCKYHV